MARRAEPSRRALMAIYVAPTFAFTWSLLPRAEASIPISLVWALWHVPLFYIAGMPQFGSPFPAFIGYTIALSVILAVLAQQTRGSVIIATLFHGAVNTFGVINTGASPTQRGWSNALSYGAAALVIGLVVRTSGASRAAEP